MKKLIATLLLAAFTYAETASNGDMLYRAVAELVRENAKLNERVSTLESSNSVINRRQIQDKIKALNEKIDLVKNLTIGEGYEQYIQKILTKTLSNTTTITDGRVKELEDKINRLASLNGSMPQWAVEIDGRLDEIMRYTQGFSPSNKNGWAAMTIDKVGEVDRRVAALEAKLEAFERNGISIDENGNLVVIKSNVTKDGQLFKRAENADDVIRAFLKDKR